MVGGEEDGGRGKEDNNQRSRTRNPHEIIHGREAT